jgi:hypothetical protein
LPIVLLLFRMNALRLTKKKIKNNFYLLTTVWFYSQSILILMNDDNLLSINIRPEIKIDKPKEEEKVY